MSFTEFPIPSVELVSVAANARSAINAMENSNDAVNNAIESDLPATLVSLGASDGENGASDAGKLAKFDANGALAVSQSINLSTAVGSVVDADAIGIAQASAANVSKKATLSTLWSWIVSKIGAITSITAGGNWTFSGASTFNGQVELSSSQAATTANSAVSRSIGDARYGITHSVIKVESVTATTTDPITLASVTLPTGTYQLEGYVASVNNINSLCTIGLRASNNIRVGLTDYYGRDSSTSIGTALVSDSTTYLSRGCGLGDNTWKRHIVGVIDIPTNNTVVSLEYSLQNPLGEGQNGSYTRKRSYLIVRKLS